MTALGQSWLSPPRSPCSRFGSRLCENASADFRKRKSFYLRVPHWSESGFLLDKIEVSAQVASGRENQFSAPVTIGRFHTGAPGDRQEGKGASP